MEHTDIAIQLYEGIDNGFLDLALRKLKEAGFKEAFPIAITKRFEDDKLVGTSVEKINWR